MYAKVHRQTALSTIAGVRGDRENLERTTARGSKEELQVLILFLAHVVWQSDATLGKLYTNRNCTLQNNNCT